MVSPISSNAGSNSTSGSGSSVNSYNNLDPEDFLKMLLAELQNQDPTSPVDSTEILQQVSQIKAIESNQKLSDTLTSLQFQQSLGAASSLLGQKITGTADDGTAINGAVDSVSVSDSKVYLKVGDNAVAMENVSAIAPK
jgi:flagellar basal-body rod modification protein FlgD